MKDRLAELQRKADKGGTLSDLHDRLIEEQATEEEARLLSNDHWHSVETFLSRVNAVLSDLRDMESLLEEIKIKHSQILIEPGVHPQFTEDLNRATESFKVKSYATQNAVRQMNAEVQKLKGDPKDYSVNGVDARIKKNQVMALTKKFQNALLAFNNEQLRYKEKCKQKITSYLSLSGRNMPEEDIDKAIENGQLFDYTKGLILAQRDKKALYDEVKSRHEDIIRLEASIRELHDLFQDMSMLLESQGEMLNHIERNVESAVDYATKAFRNVKQAKEIQASTRKKKICILIVLIIVIILLFIIGSTLFCAYVPFAPPSG
ncbi:Putative syntaxin-3 [Toxocara canis]|uniref:Putative syntaxin-3 n=1 Tax=Toxocara canis TaxID=6265 RepID=A0A0B2UZB9_TOXCA|nr:Putative syntaxin-3 [Toxocara canis]